MSKFPFSYDFLLQSLSKAQWQRLGLNRRAGVAAPLFSLHSAQSIGIGELPDLKKLVDWCKATSMSIIQLLPMNDTGFKFTPYDAQSSFALDPLYLSVGELVDVDHSFFSKEINELKKQFSTRTAHVDYGIKAAKLALLRKIFFGKKRASSRAFRAYLQDHEFWLHDYALFQVLKDKNGQRHWEDWQEGGMRLRKKDLLESLSRSCEEDLTFHKWVQWQLFEQFKSVKKFAQSRGVLLLGDIPFLVSRDSADVWAHPSYFKLGLSAGAPPDMLYANGQRWGMPPYDWENISSSGYRYLKEKLRYAENFYDIYRIDHVVGVYRVWTISCSEPLENEGLNGAFDPLEKETWEDHGRRILKEMVDNTRMLACAEDLGTVPKCNARVLREFGIPGIDIQRWTRDWGKSYDFKSPASYREASLSTVTTHDMSCFRAWWAFEAGTIDEKLFERKCLHKGLSGVKLKEDLFDPAHSDHGRLRWKKEISGEGELLKRLGLDEKAAWDLLDLYRSSFDEREKFLKLLGIDAVEEESFVRHALRQASLSASVFSVQLILDWLSIDPLFGLDAWQLRFNFPGTVNEENWSQRLPFSLEEMLKLSVNESIHKINKETGRS